MIELPHRRLNPLTGEWILVSPQRAKRPWLGQVEKTPPENIVHYDPDCYLCPGNERAGGVKNPDYPSTFVFDNDFAAILPDQSEDPAPGHALFNVEMERGICRVMCFSPRHDLTLPELELADIVKIINAWQEQTAELGAREYIRYVQVFENKGAMMGCSNPHPHCQIWTSRYIPNEPAKELERQTAYFRQNGSPLLIDYVEEEIKRGERILFTNEHFTALVPYWACWPFETMIIAHRNVPNLVALNDRETRALAEILKRLTTCYDNLFEVSFPYSMGFHQSPFDGAEHPEWTLHAHFYPPLLRSATVRKFMVGYELLANPQRDITPETAAEKLRALPAIHYKSR